MITYLFGTYPIVPDPPNQDEPTGINAGTDLGPPTGPLTTFDPHPLLDLDATVGQRSATFLFSLEDGVTGQQLGQLHPLTDSPPTLSHDTGRTIPRSLSLALGVTDTAAINTIRDRVLPYMLINGWAWPLGRYMFTDQSRQRTTAGSNSTVSLMDEMFIVDQELTVGFTPQFDEAIEAAVIRFLSTVEIARPIQPRIDSANFAATGSWSIGSHGGQVLQALAEQGDYLDPWMDNRGRLRMIRSFNPAKAAPQFDYDSHPLVTRSSIVESDDLLSAPNRFIVSSNRGDNDPFVGSADIPVTAPHSVPNRGFVIAKSDSIQLLSQTQAQAIANGLAVTASAFEKVTLSTPPDPRHDAYDVIWWRGDRWLETGWTMSLIEGGEMAHQLRKAYQ